MKHFISFSGGVESTTMCVLFGNKADAIFADTGYEHGPIYERIELVEKWCQSFHRPDFKIHKVKNDKFDSLPAFIKERNYYPSFRKRFCTWLFKIEPIDNYLKQFKDEGAEIMVGLNYDEIDLRTGSHGLLPFVKYSYPLVDNRISRAGCHIILDKAGLRPNFPPYMKRGGCIGCYFKSEKEYEAMALLNPKEFQEVQDVEEYINANWDRRNKRFTILKKRSMAEIKQNATTSLFKPEEMYPMINTVTKCGVFCNR